VNFKIIFRQQKTIKACQRLYNKVVPSALAIGENKKLN